MLSPSGEAHLFILHGYKYSKGTIWMRWVILAAADVISQIICVPPSQTDRSLASVILCAVIDDFWRRAWDRSIWEMFFKQYLALIWLIHDYIIFGSVAVFEQIACDLFFRSCHNLYLPIARTKNMLNELKNDKLNPRRFLIAGESCLLAFTLIFITVSRNSWPVCCHLCFIGTTDTLLSKSPQPLSVTWLISLWNNWIMGVTMTIWYFIISE